MMLFLMCHGIASIILTHDFTLFERQAQFNTSFESYSKYNRRYIPLWGGCTDFMQSMNVRKKFKAILYPETNTATEWATYRNQVINNNDKLKKFVTETSLLACIYVSATMMGGLGGTISDFFWGYEYYFFALTGILGVDGLLRTFAASYAYYNTRILEMNYKSTPRYKKTEVSDIVDIETASVT